MPTHGQHRTSPVGLGPTAVLVVTILVAVSGCRGAGPTGTPSPSPSVPPSVSPAPTATSPASPSPSLPSATPTGQSHGTPIPAGQPSGAPASPSPAALPRPAPDLVDLVTGGGSPFALSDSAGHWRIVFFGYTHCPDVCPATIGELMKVMEARPDVRVIFVTVDPERDTPEFMATWTRYFPDGFTGVTGSATAIARAAAAYGARYARVDTGSASGYVMAHTADQYLIDGDGMHVATYPFGMTGAEILADLERLEASDLEVEG